MSNPKDGSNDYGTRLKVLRENARSLGHLVERQYDDAVKCFSSCDSIGAAQVVGADAEVHELTRQLEGFCCDMLHDTKPAESADLRIATTTIRIVAELAHIGREAVTIARSVLNCPQDGCEINSYLTVKVIAERTGQLLHDTLEAFTQLDRRMATFLAAEDEIVEHEVDAITRSAILCMLEDRRAITPALETLSFAKAIEHVGDHIKSIAEWVLYMGDANDDSVSFNTATS